MIRTMIIVGLLTFVPFLELRASIPYGIISLGREYWLLVGVVAVLCNMLLGVVLYNFFHLIFSLANRIKPVHKIYKRHMAKAQKNIHEGVVKYGIISVALFIGIPLPGTGSYSGAFVANVLGMRRRDFFIANAIGVLISGTLVSLIVLSGWNVISIFTKT